MFSDATGEAERRNGAPSIDQLMRSVGSDVPSRKTSLGLLRSVPTTPLDSKLSRSMHASPTPFRPFRA